MTTIRFEQDQGVGAIVLANPPQNRIGSRFAEDLRVAVHEASLSDSRVLVIRSEGPNFCLGGNVPEWVGKSADWFRTFIAECNSSFHAIEALRIPTVAVVHGGAIGGGMELAALYRDTRYPTVSKSCSTATFKRSSARPMRRAAWWGHPCRTSPPLPGPNVL